MLKCVACKIFCRVYSINRSKFISMYRWWVNPKSMIFTHGTRSPTFLGFAWKSIYPSPILWCILNYSITCTELYMFLLCKFQTCANFKSSQRTRPLRRRTAVVRCGHPLPHMRAAAKPSDGVAPSRSLPSDRKVQRYITPTVDPSSSSSSPNRYHLQFFSYSNFSVKFTHASIEFYY